VNLTPEQVRLALYAVRDLMTRRTLGGQSIPRGFDTFLDQLVTSARGTENTTAAPQLTPGELIDTTEAAAILNCSPRWVRHIRNDLDGLNISGRWIFKRQTVVDYADMKGSTGDRDRLPPTRSRAIPPGAA
jgi:hypothetical protein